MKLPKGPSDTVRGLNMSDELIAVPTTKNKVWSLQEIKEKETIMENKSNI